AGFVGSWVLRAGLNAGHGVAWLRRSSTDCWRIEDVAHKAFAITGDLGAPETYREALKKFAPDAVLHLAWDGVGNRDRNDPKQDRNCQSSHDLVAACADAGAKHCIGLGSQAEYGPCSDVIVETQVTNPTTLYGQPKLAAFRHCG